MNQERNLGKIPNVTKVIVIFIDILCYIFFPAVEQIANLLKYPCRYFPMGCREAFILSKKAAHERDCPFLQLKCPFHDQCSFNGSLKDVVPHLASEHAVTPVCYYFVIDVSNFVKKF